MEQSTTADKKKRMIEDNNHMGVIFDLDGVLVDTGWAHKQSWYDLAEKDYKPFDYLADYAKYYNTVEIDQWFWSLFPIGARLPNIETVKIYSNSVPDDFLFTVKAPNSITLNRTEQHIPQRRLVCV